MKNNQRRRMGGLVGMSVGAMFAAPLISLAASAIASADSTNAAVSCGTDCTQYTVGPYTTDVTNVGPNDKNVYIQGPNGHDVDTAVFTNPQTGAVEYAELVTTPSGQELIEYGGGMAPTVEHLAPGTLPPDALLADVQPPVVTGS